MSIYRPTLVRRECEIATAPQPAAPGRRPSAIGITRWWPGSVLALALIVSACGTNSAGDDVATQDDGGASIASSADDQDGAAEPGDDGGDGAADGADEAATVPTTERAVPAVNVPTVEVLDIADGSVINLADELAGEDRALLFWFWAPH